VMRITMKDRPSKPKRSQNPNGRGIRDKSLRDGKPEQSLYTVLGDPDLRTTFPNYLQLLDTISGDPEKERTFARLISDGCTPRNLLLFLNACVWEDEAVGSLKKDLDSLKSQFDGLIRRLETTSAKIVSVGTMRIGDNPVRDSLAFDSIDARVATKFARDYFFIELPASLVWAKAFLKELKQNLAEEHTVRRPTRGMQLAYLYLYCCASTGRRVTYREIADLLNAGLIARDSGRLIDEATVRMGLIRFKNSAEAMSYELLESQMKDYVRSCPTGRPTFDVWFDCHGADWISSNVKPLCPGRVISEKERRLLTLKERERPKKKSRSRARQ
jgi:hypothetical protein